MRKTGLILLLLWISLFANAQPEKLILRGGTMIPADWGTEISAMVLDPLAGVDEIFKGKIGEKGEISLEIPMWMPLDIAVTVGGKTSVMSVAPGMELEFFIMENGDYAFPSQKENSLVENSWKWDSWRQKEWGSSSRFQETKLLGDQLDVNLKTEIAENWKEEEAALDKYFKKNKKAGDEFYKWAKADIQFRYLEYLRRVDINQSNPPTLAELKKSAEEYFPPYEAGSAAYHRYTITLLNSIKGTVVENLKKDGITGDVEVFTAIYEEMKAIGLKEVRLQELSRLFYNISLNTHPQSVEWLQPMFKEYMDEYGETPFATEIIRQAEATRAQNPSFADVLEKHKGKVILIDCWASWCGPCMMQMPFMHQLKDSLATEENVSFVYFSFDRDMERWKQTIQAKGLIGEHYFLGQGRLGQEVNQKFRVSGIPRYILINKDGTVENANAPRPGTVINKQWVFNDALLEKIREMLEE